MGRWEAYPDKGLHVVPGSLGAQAFLEGNGQRLSHFLGKVFDAVEHIVTWGLEHRTLSQIDAIGVDEIQYAKGHKYLTLVYQIDIGITRLLWVGKERTMESFQGFFTAMGQGVISQIAFICSDMWEPYLKLIREKCSEALPILDRFHIVAKMNKALDEVRAEETRRMRREGRDPVLKKSRWLLLKRSENLADENVRIPPTLCPSAQATPSRSARSPQPVSQLDSL